MLIDWFTVAAQVVNFLILVYLLKRFLYGPIIKAMDEREKKIADRLDDAKRKRQDAQQQRELYEQKKKEVEGSRDELLSQAKKDAEDARKALVEKAREEVDGLRDKWRKTVEREKEAFLHGLRLRTSRHAHNVARRALQDLADVDLEGHIVRVFSTRLRNLGEKGIEALRESIVKSKGKVRVATAFDISSGQLEEIGECLRQIVAGPVEIEKHRSQDLICGVELMAGGTKIAWGLGEYLEELEAAVIDSFEELQPVESASGGAE